MDTASLLRTCVTLQRIALDDREELGEVLVSRIDSTNQLIRAHYERIALALLTPILGLEFSRKLLRKYLH
jgi:hypothetical protein